MTATLHPVLWIVFWIFAPGFTLCALALICYAVFGPPTGVELEEKRQQSFLDRMDAAAKEKPRMFVLDEHPLPSKEEQELLARALGNMPPGLVGLGGHVMLDELGKFIECTTCQGLGTIDETLADPGALCPDCKP